MDAFLNGLFIACAAKRLTLDGLFISCAAKRCKLLFSTLPKLRLFIACAAKRWKLLFSTLPKLPNLGHKAQLMTKKARQTLLALSTSACSVRKMDL